MVVSGYSTEMLIPAIHSQVLTSSRPFPETHEQRGSLSIPLCPGPLKTSPRGPPWFLLHTLAWVCEARGLTPAHLYGLESVTSELMCWIRARCPGGPPPPPPPRVTPASFSSSSWTRRCSCFTRFAEAAMAAGAQQDGDATSRRIPAAAAAALRRAARATSLSTAIVSWSYNKSHPPSASQGLPPIRVPVTKGPKAARQRDS